MSRLYAYVRAYCAQYDGLRKAHAKGHRNTQDSDKREKQSERRNRLLQPVAGSGGVYGCNVRDLSYSQDEKKALALPWRGCPVACPGPGGPRGARSLVPPCAPWGEISILSCVFLSSTIYTIIALVL